MKITSFASQNVTQKALQECQPFATKPLNILIDLRSNQGGHLTDALKFSALFVTSNALIRVDEGGTTAMITRPVNHPFIHAKKSSYWSMPKPHRRLKPVRIFLKNTPTPSLLEKTPWEKPTSAGLINNHPNSPVFICPKVALCQIFFIALPLTWMTNKCTCPPLP